MNSCFSVTVVACRCAMFSQCSSLVGAMPYNIHYLHLLGHWMRMAGVDSTKRNGRQGPGALQQLKPYIQSWCCWLLEIDPKVTSKPWHIDAACDTRTWFDRPAPPKSCLDFLISDIFWVKACLANWKFTEILPAIQDAGQKPKVFKKPLWHPIRQIGSNWLNGILH